MSSKSPLAAVLVKSRNGRDQLRFVPVCCECGAVILDVRECNIAIADASPLKLEPIGRVGSKRVFLHSGEPRVFCWDCDRKQHIVPWQPAESTFRTLDEVQR